MYKKFGKRVLDIVLAIILLIILFVPMLLIGIIIKLDSPGPVFFRQRRLGKDKKEFGMIKFRSMSTLAPKYTPKHKLKGAMSYISPFGRFIRKYSIDELPQLFNILGGSMSFVGPRPALYNQYDLIEARDRYGANTLTPGLSGWAQINGRDEIDTERKAALDGEYLEKQSFLFDLYCLFRTLKVVLLAEGVVEGEMEE